MTFFHHQAFSRNIGWVSEYEQQALRQKTVAIGGMGGVGGVHLLTCVRLGIEKFHIADFDIFELGNFNRQAGATLSTLNKEKAAALKKMALDINPNCSIKIFSKGVNGDNIVDFLTDVDLYIDGIDLFAMEARRLIFNECHKKKIPAVTAGPLGMSAAYMIFTPDSMSFEDYFDFKSCSSESDIVIHFAFGLAPAGLHRSYLMDESRVNFTEGKGPSTIMGCQLCSGVAVTEALKILLKRGKVYAAPYTHQFDAYRNKYKRAYFPFGNRNILQKCKLKLAKKFIGDLSEQSYPYKDDYKDPIDRILHYAKWTPSGHNEQNCTWERLKGQSIKVTALETTLPVNRHEKQRVTLNMLGVFLETLQQSAHFFGYKLIMNNDLKKEEKSYVLSLSFQKLSKPVDSLGNFIKARFTDRRPFKLTKLTTAQKKALEACLDENYTVSWRETVAEKTQATHLNAKSMKLEIQHPLYYEELQSAIKLNSQFSAKRIPDKSFNFSLLTRFILRKVLPDKKLYTTMSKFGGFVMPIIETSLIPDMCSGAHILLTRKKEDVKDLKSEKFEEQAIQDGRMIQRFWLTATSLGLVLQPTFIQLAFSREPKGKTHIGNTPKFKEALESIRKLFIKTNDIEPERAMFAARLGFPKDRRVYSRSTRR